MSDSIQEAGHHDAPVNVPYSLVTLHPKTLTANKQSPHFCQVPYTLFFKVYTKRGNLNIVTNMFKT
jgi:hypothetical protein